MNHFVKTVLPTYRHDPCADEVIEPLRMNFISLTDYHLTADKPPTGDSLSKPKLFLIAELHGRDTAETVETVLLRRTDSTVSA